MLSFSEFGALRKSLTLRGICRPEVSSVGHGVAIIQLGINKALIREAISYYKSWEVGQGPAGRHLQYHRIP